MNDQINHVFVEFQQMSDDALKIVLERILDEIDEREWNVIVNKSHVKKRLRELGRQALKEERAGETEEGGFDCQ